MLGFRFRVESFLANFRPPSSVTNQLSFFIPPKSAVLGMVAAMAGVIKPLYVYKPARELYLNRKNLLNEEFRGVKLGIRVARRLNKTYDYVLFTKGKKPKEGRIPSKIEWLTNPSYEFIVLSDDEDWVKIFEKASKMEFFKVYLGNANAPAAVTYKELIEKDTGDDPPPEKIITRWVTPREYIRSIDNTATGRFVTEKIYGQWFLIPINSTLAIEPAVNGDSQQWVKIGEEYIPVF